MARIASSGAHAEVHGSAGAGCCSRSSVVLPGLAARDLARPVAVPPARRPGEPTTPIVARQRGAEARRRSPTCSPSAGRRRARRVAAWSRRPGPTPPTTPCRVRYQTRDGASGVDVVRPAVPADGPALLVDRGWLEPPATGAGPTARRPRPPSGEVTVTGWVRARRHRRQHARSPTGRPARSPARRSARRSAAGATAGSSTSRRSRPSPADALVPRRAARPRQRAALLLRPAVVVLRGAGGVRLLLPGLRRAQERLARPAAGPRRGRAVRASGACRRRPAASRR